MKKYVFLITLLISITTLYAQVNFQTFEKENMVKMIPEGKEVDFEWRELIFKSGRSFDTNKTKLTSYAISRYEVTQLLYQKVMGNNPSQFKGGQLPVETVTWYDAVFFCNELTKITLGEKNCCYSITNIKKDGDGNIIDAKVAWDKSKKGYRLPTSPEWEYAALGGDKGGWDYVYSGTDNDPEDVAWCGTNSNYKTHTVGTKKPNMAGLYDMSGNVWEWCWDERNYISYGVYETYEKPIPYYNERVLRGGCYSSSSPGDSCDISEVDTHSPYGKDSGYGFRVCRSLDVPLYSNRINLPTFESENIVKMIPEGKEVDFEWKDFIFKAGGVVENTIITKLTSYAIGRYEVTQSLYQKVMGNNPSQFKGEKLPVENVTWYDAVYFCNELTKITMGEKNCCYSITNVVKNKDGNIIEAKVTWDDSKKGYRLPTSQEWEYAARGGDKGGWDYHYSGSDDMEEVAWYIFNSDGKTHDVGTKQANKAGIYDMTGNVSEWCWNEDSSDRVKRGGSYYTGDDFDSFQCTVSYPPQLGP